jgi:hypothetical protein
MVPVKERALIVRATLDEAIKHSSIEAKIIQLLELYNHALMDQVLAAYIRPSEHGNDEYVVRPEDQSLFETIFKRRYCIGPFTTLFISLPDDWMVGGRGNSTFAFPELKEQILNTLLGCMEPDQFLAFLLTIKTRWREAQSLLEKYVRLTCEKLYNWDIATHALRSVMNTPYEDGDLYVVVLRSIEIARTKTRNAQQIKEKFLKEDSIPVS